MTEGDFTRVIVWDEDGDDAEEAVSDDGDEDDVQQQAEPQRRTRFKYNRDKERQERELFAPKNRAERHRCVFVVVPDRSTQTLTQIIKKCVKPDTYVFSDKWDAYNALDGTFRHSQSPTRGAS